MDHFAVPVREAMSREIPETPIITRAKRSFYRRCPHYLQYYSIEFGDDGGVPVAGTSLVVWSTRECVCLKHCVRLSPVIPTVHLRANPRKFPLL